MGNNPVYPLITAPQGAIVNDTETTNTVSASYIELTDEETAALSSLYQVDDDLMKYWLGEGGDAFELLAGELEKRIKDLSTFTDNSSNALFESINNFNGTDTDRQGSLDVFVTVPSGQGG